MFDDNLVAGKSARTTPTERASETRSRLREKCQLFRGRRTFQYLVAVRKPAKAGDDIAVGDRVATIMRVTELLEKSDRKILIGERFAVLEGKVEKQPACRCNLPIGAGVQGSAREIQRFGVAIEHPCTAAKHIARELIERDQGRERGVGRGQQRGDQRGVRQVIVDAEKSLPNALIERVVLREPGLWAQFGEPEIEDGSG